MICVIATLIITPGREAEYEALFRQRMDYARDHEPGTLVYQLARDPQAPGRYKVIEIYLDAAAAEAHRTTPEFLALSARSRDMIVGTPQIERLEGVAA